MQKISDDRPDFCLDEDDAGIWLLSVGVPEAEDVLRVSAFEVSLEGETFRYLRLESRAGNGDWVPLLGVQLEGVPKLITALITGVLNAEVAETPTQH